MHSHIRREKELMKWQCCAISGRPNTGAANEPLWREGTVERFWEKQADSFVFMHYIQGKWRVFLFLFYTNWECDSHSEETQRQCFLHTKRYSNLDLSC